MSRDPFCNYKLKKVKKDRGYLTKAELERIIDFELDNKRLEKVRDIFVFCCFTGFDYSTTATLTDKNIAQDDEGDIWIETHRVKTGTPSKIKLLDIPLSILRKYELKRRRKLLVAGNEQRQVQSLPERDRRTVRNSEERDLAPREAHFCHDGYLR